MTHIHRKFQLQEVSVWAHNLNTFSPQYSFKACTWF